MKLLSFVFIVLCLIIVVNLNIGLAQEEFDKKTGVVIDKKVYGDLLNSELVYKIRTPKMVHFDFVLAVDSSGSLGKGGDNFQESAVKEAIPEFLRKIPKAYPDILFNVSIVSWDNGIDFAYYDFDNIDPAKAELTSIANAINDSGKFADNFICQETETTDISSAIKASMNILDAEVNRPNDYHKNRRFILLVTGKSEFEPCDPKLLDSVLNKYPIYVVGMDLDNPSEMRKHLKEELAENDENRWKFISAGSSELEPTLNKTLELALLSHLDNAIKAPVAYDVKIEESLYSYIKPKYDSLRVNGLPSKSIVIDSSNPDGTIPITIYIPEGLKPNTEIEISFGTEFSPHFPLPISVTKDRKAVMLCSPHSDTPNSKFNFNWFNGYRCSMELPAGNLSNERLETQSVESLEEATGRGNSITSLILLRILSFAGIKLQY